MTAAEERPWLWVIYILTIGLPVGLVVLFCWPKVPQELRYVCICNVFLPNEQISTRDQYLCHRGRNALVLLALRIFFLHAEY